MVEQSPAREVREAGWQAAVTPRGSVVVEWAASRAGGAPSGSAGARGERPDSDAIGGAFARGTGHGILHLGAAELEADLDPSVAFWRELGRRFVAAACGAIDPTDPGATPRPLPPDLTELAAAVPPMRGAELVDAELLRGIWEALGAALAERAAEHEGGVRAWLAASHSLWHVAGRICLHLAENKRDPAHPFAFIATYARVRPGQPEAQHVPLGRALQEYAGDRAQLLALLLPLQRAAQSSPLVRGLVDSGDIYHPLAWTPREAHALLTQVEQLERAGLVVRLPDWWRKASRRPSVSVTVGGRAPSQLGLGALLDFHVAVTLGDEVLTEEELQSLLRSSAGLVLLKGRWVEVDAERLEQVLEQWQHLQEQAGEGVGFGEAMRLLAGADLGVEGLHEDPRPEWSQVVAGPWLRAQLDSLRSPSVTRDIDRNAGLRAELRPYQKVGVQWLWTLHHLGLGGCLADDMGLGKTIQVIGLLSLLQAQASAPHLLVVPASLLENWRAELARFGPQLRVLVAHSSQLAPGELYTLEAERVDAHDVVITTYGAVLRVDWMKARRWGCVVLDEAQAIKNPGAGQTRAVKKLQGQWRLALTGTPVENRLGDLWSLFDFLNPGLLGSAAAFSRLTRRMERPDGRGYGPLRRLVGPYILRRLKTDRRVIGDLPDKTELTAHCLLSKTQAALYQSSVDELGEVLRSMDGMARRGAVLAFLLRFKQICNHPSQWLGDGEFAPADSGKFKRLAALCEPIAARQEKLLIFTQFRTLTGPLQRFAATCFGRPGLVLHGGTPVRKRQELVRRFQEDDAVPFLVLSLKAGGTGLNLTAANHVVHFDRWWNPAVENQATDRAFRIGQRRNVLVHKFVCQGTVEERIDALIADKQQMADQVLSGGGEVKLTELGDDELLAMVRLDLASAVSS